MSTSFWLCPTSPEILTHKCFSPVLEIDLYFKKCDILTTVYCQSWKSVAGAWNDILWEADREASSGPGPWRKQTDHSQPSHRVWEVEGGFLRSATQVHPICPAHVGRHLASWDPAVRMQLLGTILNIGCWDWWAGSRWQERRAYRECRETQEKQAEFGGVALSFFSWASQFWKDLMNQLAKDFASGSCL